MTLSAKRTPTGVQVKAGAESSGAADGEYRMRLLLVEEKVMMPAASNGVRVQEMVVRWQLDGGVLARLGCFPRRLVPARLDAATGRHAQNGQRGNLAAWPSAGQPLAGRQSMSLSWTER